MPSAQTWADILQNTTVVGNPHEHYPLIIDENNKLYLARYWKYENDLAKNIIKRSQQPGTIIDPSKLSAIIARIFSNSNDSHQIPDWQQIAVTVAAKRPFQVITGGPGTGKTTTVISLLAILLEMNPNANLAITLTAPTGKAANRLTESILSGISRLNASDEIKQQIPKTVSTIHRLLGSRNSKAIPLYNTHNKLFADIIIVDEASMIDLPLMAKLFNACADNTKILLIGDKYQLSSVEAGSVLADICDAGIAAGLSSNITKFIQQTTGTTLTPSVDGGLQDIVIELKHSHRFSATSDIGMLASAINNGDEERAIEMLTNNQSHSISFIVINDSTISNYLNSKEINEIAGFLNEQNVGCAIEQFNHAKILCSHREGALGLNNINAIIEKRLHNHGIIDTTEEHYHGRPIMITKNDYNLGLFNGDVGLIWNNPEKNSTRAYFKNSDGQLNQYLPSRLPSHETIFAMTIHKSQGSEFNNVTIIMPNEQTELVSRELLYTAITRAKTSVQICASVKTLKHAISTKTDRSSGLFEKLKQHNIQK